MLKLVNSSKKFILSMVGVFAMFVGITSASAGTALYIHQPECPKHLLK